jgi:hypothetical protein
MATVTVNKVKLVAGLCKVGLLALVWYWLGWQGALVYVAGSFNWEGFFGDIVAEYSKGE